MRAIIAAGLYALLCFCSTASANDRALEAARVYLVERYNLSPEQTRVEMRANRSFDEVQPSDSIHVYSTTDTPPRGSCSLRFEIIRGGVVTKSISASVKVETWKDVYLPTRAIKRGEPLALSDFEVMGCDVTFDHDKVIDVPFEFEGFRAKKALRVGDPTDWASIEAIPLVNRGDEVVIRCVTGSLEITTIGIAREDGGKGEIIEVANKETKKRIQAEVLDAGLVAVNR